MTETIGERRQREITEAVLSQVRTGEIDPELAGTKLLCDLFNDGVVLGTHGIDLDMPADNAEAILNRTKNCTYHASGTCFDNGCLGLSHLRADLQVSQNSSKVALFMHIEQARAFLQRCREFGCRVPDEKFEEIIVQFPS